MSKSKPPAASCTARRGFANPLDLTITYMCDNCAGELHCDGINAMGNRGFLMCTTCGCVYAIAATKEIRR